MLLSLIDFNAGLDIFRYLDIFTFRDATNSYFFSTLLLFSDLFILLIEKITVYLCTVSTIYLLSMSDMNISIFRCAKYLCISQYGNFSL